MACACLLQVEHTFVLHFGQITSKGCFGSTLFLRGMNSLQVDVGQKMRSSHGVAYWFTAFRKFCCSLGRSIDMTVVVGRANVQHLGGILDSSDMAFVAKTRRHASQYLCPQGNVCNVLPFSNSSRQQIQKDESCSRKDLVL